MSYFARTDECQGPMGNSPMHTAVLWSAGKPRFRDGGIETRDQTVMAAYGPTPEAALLQLRSSLLSAAAAVEQEVHNLRLRRVRVVDLPVLMVADVGDDDEDDEDIEETEAEEALDAHGASAADGGEGVYEEEEEGADGAGN